MSRICHVVRQFSPSVGGLETFVQHLAAQLVAHGHECEVLTLDRLFRAPEARLAPFETIDSLAVTRVPMMGHPRLFTPLLQLGALKRYDVVHVHGIDGMFDRLSLEPRRPGQVLVATTHGGFFHTPWMKTAKRLYFHTITRAAAQRYDAIIANSSADRSMMQHLRHNVVHIPNGVLPLQCRAEGHDLFCHGRLASHKRLDLVIDALAQAPLRDVQLHIVGPEWDVKLASLRDYALSKGVADRVRLHGPVSTGELYDIASHCGAFVSASEYEGFGMALIEAFSAGLSAVVAGNGSFEEIMQAAPIGRIVDFNQPAVAAAAIAEELQRISEFRRSAARRFAETYSWERNATRTQEVYDMALRHRRKQAA